MKPADLHFKLYNGHLKLVGLLRGNSMASPRQTSTDACKMQAAAGLVAVLCKAEWVELSKRTKDFSVLRVRVW